MKSRFQYSFTVPQVSKTINVDTLLNITKRKEHLIYRSSSSQDNINISYITSEDTNSNDNLSILDKSYSLIENRIPYEFEYQTKTGTQFQITAEQFLLTDVFVPETPTQPEIPLFYRHRLSSYNYELDNFTNLSLVSYEFNDKNFNKINNNEYYLDQNTGDLYNNVQNWYDQDTGEYDITYIKYTVKDSTISTAPIINVYYELINNQRVYSLATWNDIDEFSNLKIYGSTYDGVVYRGKAYFIEEVTGTIYLKITTPKNQQYSYKEIIESKIRLIKPDVINTELPWYIRVSNGKFLANIRDQQNGNSSSYKYYVPEYSAQNFNPYPPYKQHLGKECLWIDKTIIKSQVDNIISNNEFFVHIIVHDSEDNLKYAFTTDSSKIGTYYSGSSTILYTDGIRSIDCLNGIFELDEEVEDTDIITIYCYAEEFNLEYSSIDFNPLTNSEILKHKTVFYAIPEPTGITSFEKAIHYLTIDENGLIIYSSQADDGLPIHSSTSRLLLEDFETDGTPKHDFYYDYPSTASGLLYRYGGTYSSFVDKFNFIDKYTTDSQITYEKLATWSGIVGSGELIENFEDNAHILILGEVAVGESINAELLETFDVRMRGGGIKENYDENAIDLQREVVFYWDKNSSFPYPSASTFMVEYPRELLEENGGEFTVDEVRKIVEKHTMCGNYPVIRNYGNLDPVATDIIENIVGSSVEIQWPRYGASSYNIYYWQVKENQMHSITGISEAISGNNSQTISSLKLQTDYLFYIESIDSNGISYPGPVYKFNL